MSFDQIYNYIADQLVHNEFFSGAALGGALGGLLLSLGYYARNIPMRIWRRLERYIFYSVTIEQEDKLHKYIDLWGVKHFPKALRRVEAFTDIDDKILYTHENDYIFFWKNYRRLTISKTKQRLEAASDSFNMFNRTYTISGLFARKVITNWLEEVLQYGLEYDKSRTERKLKPDIWISDEYGSWTRTKGVGKTFDSIYLEDKERIINDLESFKLRQEIYVKLGVPYKRGYLFWGLPGNGKSSLAYAIAAHMKYDIYCTDLSGMSSTNFVRCVRNIPDKSVLLVEDIDAFYNGREALKENKISFSTFLNALSGVASKNNVITVLTTNHIGNIDSALLRTGRCDFIFETQQPTKEVVEEFLGAIFGVATTLEKAPSISFVKLQEIVFANLDNLENCLKEINNHTLKPITRKDKFTSTVSEPEKKAIVWLKKSSKED